MASLIASLSASLIRCARRGRPQGRRRLLLRHLRWLLVQRQTGRRRGRRRHSDGGCPCACAHLDLRRPHSQARTPPATCFPQLRGMHASAHRGGATWHAFSPSSSHPLHRYLVPGVLGALLLRSWLRSEMNAMWTGSAVPPATLDTTLEDESHSELCSYQEPSSGYSPTSSTSPSQVN